MADLVRHHVSEQLGHTYDSGFRFRGLPNTGEENGGVPAEDRGQDRDPHSRFAELRRQWRRKNMNFNRADRSCARDPVRDSYDWTEYPGHFDANGFQQPCRLLFSYLEHSVSDGRLIEQLHWEMLTNRTSKARGNMQRSKKDKCTRSRHSQSVHTALFDCWSSVY